MVPFVEPCTAATHSLCSIFRVVAYAPYGQRETKSAPNKDVIAFFASLIYDVVRGSTVSP